MAVASRGAALSALRTLLGTETVPAAALLRRPYLPDGMEPRADPSRMDETTSVGGYGNEARYALGVDEVTARIIAGPPADVLGGQPSITTSVVEAYVKSSIDLTMQGGTTSGVVYPLAVCELATDFRFRNVGGASAGAIAAALTAAAELGRSAQVRTPGPAGESGGLGIRQGFVGVTDIIAWLTQTRPGDPDTDEFRLAQLFRPGSSMAGLFRVLVATMRRRTWAVPLLALTAFGWLARVIAVVLVVATVVLTGLVGRNLGSEPRSGFGTMGGGLLGSGAFLVLAVGLVLLLQGIQSARRRPGQPSTGSEGWPTRLRGATSSSPTPRTRTRAELIAGVSLVVLAGVIGWLSPAFFGAGLIVGLASTLILIVVLLTSVLSYVMHLRGRSYGLIAGTAPRPPRRSVLDRLAGVPEPTVEKSVLGWLNDCLSQLAGLRVGEVLRFGHLWAGTDFHLTRVRPTPELQADWRRMSERTDLRLVNLELMTTDLSRQRPYRFPLPAVNDPQDGSQLWLCLDQLSEGDNVMFPTEVVAALAESESRQVADRSGTVRTLHRLPQPWDLPVIVAVRLSMALPGLFQAVRMYRIVPSAPVQDDFGRDLLDSGTPLSWPQQDDLADELWFSDGGITSNFPVHFFDASLPRWPTVSLNLGKYPEAAPHQDVNLPQDWDVASIPVEPLTESGLSLVGAIFSTAMSWRDSMQSSMPGYRNRIAQVRTRPDEGGANLFMTREVIASMALRGALAGARLRTRFADTSHWNRFRWLRLRVAVSNLERLRQSTQTRRGFYLDAFAGHPWLEEQKATFSDQPADVVVPWYDPEPRFWPEAPRLLNTFVDAYRPPDDPAPNVMTTSVPRPEPVLRQVPQE